MDYKHIDMVLRNYSSIQVTTPSLLSPSGQTVASEHDCQSDAVCFFVEFQQIKWLRRESDTLAAELYKKLQHDREQFSVAEG